jgi:hypothetical protein
MVIKFIIRRNRRAGSKLCLILTIKPNRGGPANPPIDCIAVAIPVAHPELSGGVASEAIVSQRGTHPTAEKPNRIQER